MVGLVTYLEVSSSCSLTVDATKAKLPASSFWHFEALF